MKRFSLSFVVAATLMSLAAAKGAYPLVGSEKPATPQPPAQSITKAVEEASLSELSGTVVETMNAGGYTYVCLEKKGKKTWAAVPEMRVKVGQKLTLAPGAEMTNFKSTKLNRTFEKIIFSTGPLAARGPSPSPRDTSSPSGKVVETMNAGGYTYVCLEKKGKKTWVAVPEMAVSVGQKLTFRPGVEMTNFTSKKTQPHVRQDHLFRWDGLIEYEHCGKSRKARNRRQQSRGSGIDRQNTGREGDGAGRVYGGRTVRGQLKA